VVGGAAVRLLITHTAQHAVVGPARPERGPVTAPAAVPGAADPILFALAPIIVIFLHAGEVTDGVRWLQDALYLDPFDRESHRELGEYYRKAGDREKAEHHFRLAGP
jgi:hypothetical protein